MRRSIFLRLVEAASKCCRLRRSAVHGDLLVYPYKLAVQVEIVLEDFLRDSFRRPSQLVGWDLAIGQRSQCWGVLRGGDSCGCNNDGVRYGTSIANSRHIASSNPVAGSLDRSFVNFRAGKQLGLPRN